MKRKNWYKLDNTAKIMPSTTNNLNTNVFRLVCTLKEEIDKKILQEALDKTLIEFPMFLYTMKDGFFWHYLEKSFSKPLVVGEIDHVCSRIDNDFLFRVSYYKKRINLEVYHVLSDGNGSMEFLKYLICTYLNIKHKLDSNIPLNDSSVFEKAQDDFETFDNSDYKIHVKKIKKAYKIKAPKKDNIYHDVIEMNLSVNETKSASKKYNATITIYIAALLIKSIIENTKLKDRKKSIGITLPVDLRHIFPSKTSRNFFYTVIVSYKPKQQNEIKDIINDISIQLKEQLEKENLQKKMNTYMVIEKLLFIRLIPNSIKDIALKYIATHAKKGETMIFSNLGIIKTPEQYEEYIESFGAISSTDTIQLTACSFKDTFKLSFSSHLINKEIERKFLKELQNDIKGEIEIISNIGSDNNA